MKNGDRGSGRDKEQKERGAVNENFRVVRDAYRRGEAIFFLALIPQKRKNQTIPSDCAIGWPGQVVRLKAGEVGRESSEALAIASSRERARYDN